MKKVIPQMEPYFDDAETNAIYRYMKSGGWLTEFGKTKEMEQMISDFTGAPYCIMTTNGTISLIIALLALDIKPGEEILIPNLTMIASPNSAKLLGIKPTLVDIDPKTLCIDINEAEKKLSKHTKALMYVPFNGRSGKMEEAVGFCKKNNLFLIEDAAQALGSFYNGKHLGTFGDIGSFSFSTPKIITTGQGGALITRKKSIYNKIKKIKDFGRKKGGIDNHEDWGWNFKFTDIQSVIGIEQMKKLENRIKLKKKMFKKYKDTLSDVKQVEFLETDLDQTSPWFIDIYVSDPDKLQNFLKSKGIGTRRIYPAVSSQKIYKKEYKKDAFSVSEKYASRGLWLPSSVKLTNQEIETVVKAIREYYNS